MDLREMPRIILEYPIDGREEPMMRIHMPYNRVQLKEDSFANYSLEYLWDIILSPFCSARVNVIWTFFVTEISVSTT